MRPTIAAPLTNIRAEEGKTVNLESLVTATTMSDWTLFTWLKNGDVINSNPHKYNITKEINPYRDKIKSILTIYNISKEDDANYTLIVYYDTDVLMQYGITGDFFNQTTGSLQVNFDNKGMVCVCITLYYYYNSYMRTATEDNSITIIVAVLCTAAGVGLLVISIIISYFIYKRITRNRSNGRNASGKAIAM